MYPGEFYVVAIPRNVPLDGRPRRFGDVTDKEVQFAAGEDLTGLEIHMTRR